MAYILSGEEFGYCGPLPIPSVTLVTLLSRLGEPGLSTRKTDVLWQVGSISEVPGESPKRPKGPPATACRQRSGLERHKARLDR